MDERDYKAMNAIENKLSFFNWNTLSLDQMVEHLREKYMFSSSGDAKCIHHLIEFYDKHKNQTI